MMNIAFNSATVSVGAAWAIFLGTYAVVAFGKLPGTKLDRTAAATIGAILMFAFRVVTPSTGIASIDYATIVLLFSMMLIVAGLHLSGFFEWIAALVLRHVHDRHLLPAVIFASGLLSAFLVNDVVCLFMVPLVLNISARFKREPVPLLLALATASNIGSAATITGNPQNILIGSLSRIPYTTFLARLGPIALAGLFIDWAVIHWVYERRRRKTAAVPVPHQEVSAPRTHVRWPLLVMTGVLVAFLLGVAPPLAAATGAALMLLGRYIDREKIFEEVDWSLLVLFIGLFLVIGGAEQAGIAERLLRIFEWGNLSSPLALSAAVVALSNLVSNVPAVMLLKNLPESTPDPSRTWMLLSLVSTLAGNLTITGSVANIIVVEKSRSSAPIAFTEYLRVGVPVTVLTIGVGFAWLLLT